MSARIIALSTAALAAATVGLAKIVKRAEQRQEAPPAPPRPIEQPEPAPAPAPVAAADEGAADDDGGELALPVVRGARGRFVSKRKPPAAAAL